MRQRISHLQSKYFIAKLFRLPQGQISLKKALAFTSAFFLAGVAGFEPANAAVKVLCLTA